MGTILYEDDDLKGQTFLASKKAMTIIQQFLLSSGSLIQEQISTDVEFRPLSLYDSRDDGSLLIEAKFANVDYASTSKESAEFGDLKHLSLSLSFFVVQCAQNTLDLRTHFINCHLEGLPTFPKSNTCIDYLFGHSSLAPRLTNSQLLYMPSRWTDHSLLTVDLLPATASIGPGSWRFNPTLLDDKEFLALLNATASLFFSGAVGSRSRGTNTSQGGRGDPESTVARWESFKLLLKCCAQKYTRGMKARFKKKVFTLQLQRIRALSTSVSGIGTRNAVDPTDRVSPDSGDTEQVRQLLLCDKLGHKTYIAVYLGEYLPHLAETRI
ncbi:hypothetical protein HMPREF1544_10185 [Mucor circinelloides 1006PhL]|uniref:Uncharacterized protein n=1 Tax=Mucor circinelloides f. circinelloides (strain 1006PhL) TaxID=1220926 RepID=S2JKH7_MUCC1|nr:hypothetical protein HMPREF1544_10185 [Mucor circinelloides 1006PhL]